MFGLETAWIEVTNKCNLLCSHCYAESSSRAADSVYGFEDFVRMINAIGREGCAVLCFIGGEPLLYDRLDELVTVAANAGVRQIEIFSNLTFLPDRVLNAAVAKGVCFATSFYSDKPAVHDAITKGRGSFVKTVQNLQRVIAAGIDVRASIIVSEQNRDDVAGAESLLRSLGVKNFSVDQQRPFGRALVEGQPAYEDLCGRCAGATICYHADGTVSPCIMTKAWSIASDAAGLAGDLACEEMQLIRARIRSAVETRVQELLSADCGPQGFCAPTGYCAPTGPCGPSGWCGPTGCAPANGPCAPQACNPQKGPRRLDVIST